MPAEAAVEQVDVATAAETEPGSERVAPTPPHPSRWHKFVASAPTPTDGAPSTPGRVDAFLERAAAEPTPKRTKGSGREAEFDSSHDENTVESGTVESIAEVEGPVVEARAPISEVAVELDATVPENGPAPHRDGPPAPERGSRYDKLVASAPSQLDTETARDDDGTFIEPDAAVTSPKRVKGRRRRARVERQIDTTHGTTSVGPTVELASEGALTVEDDAAPMSGVVEFDTATTSESASVPEHVASPAQERGSRSNKLHGTAPSKTDTEAVDVDAFAEPDEIEPIGESNIAADAATVSETETALALALEGQPPTERGSRWDKLVAAGVSQIDSTTADVDAGPERNGTATPKQIRRPRRRIKVGRQIDTMYNSSIVEPGRAAPIAEIEVPTAGDAPVDVNQPTTEAESDPGAGLDGSRWDKLVASGAGQIGTDVVDAFAEPDETRPTPKRIRSRRGRRTQVGRQIDTNDEVRAAELRSEEPIAEIEAPTAVDAAVDVERPSSEPEAECARWRTQVAGTSSSPPLPAISTPQRTTWTRIAEPDETRPTPKRIRSRRGRRTRVERQFETNDEVRVVELQRDARVAEIEAAVDVKAPTPEPASRADTAGTHATESRWNKFQVAASSRVEAPGGPTATDEAPETEPTLLKGRRFWGAKPALPAEMAPVSIDGATSERELGSDGTDVTQPVSEASPRTKRRVRRAKTTRDTVAASPPPLKPTQADVEESNEPTATQAGPVLDIAVEPISDLATVVPAVETPIVDAPLVDGTVTESPAADSPADDPGTERVADDIRPPTEQADKNRWQRRARTVPSRDIEPQAKVLGEVESGTDAAPIEVVTESGGINGPCRLRSLSSLRSSTTHPNSKRRRSLTARPSRSANQMPREHLPRKVDGSDSSPIRPPAQRWRRRPLRRRRRRRAGADGLAARPGATKQNQHRRLRTSD